MNKIWGALALISTLLIVGCSGAGSVDKESRTVYEAQKKHEAIDRAQREAEAAGRRLDKAIKNQ